MPNPHIPIEKGRFYHIYNRGINSCDIFSNKTDYHHFLYLYDKYVEPVAETYAWVLMKNHFHVLVYIKDNIVYKYKLDEINKNAVGFMKWETTDPSAFKEPDGVENGRDANKKTPNPTKHFSHLFNAYAKYFNLKYKRHGSLFERPFKRKVVDDTTYLQQVILYIHYNPVHHGLCAYPIEYPWSSYLTCLTEKATKFCRKQVLGYFGDRESFKLLHSKCYNIIDFDTDLEE